jgi:hypothetical protein
MDPERKMMLPMNDPLISKLVGKLSDRDPRTRYNAVGTLRIHGPRAIPAMSALAQLLEDEDPVVRDEAQRTLQILRRFAA